MVRERTLLKRKKPSWLSPLEGERLRLGLSPPLLRRLLLLDRERLLGVSDGRVFHGDHDDFGDVGGDFGTGAFKFSDSSVMLFKASLCPTKNKSAPPF